MSEREFFTELASGAQKGWSGAWCDAVADRIKQFGTTERFEFPSAVVVLQTAFDEIVVAWDYDHGTPGECEPLLEGHKQGVSALLAALSSGEGEAVVAASDAIARTILARY